jgi:hypothetical protein
MITSHKCFPLLLFSLFLTLWTLWGVFQDLHAYPGKHSFSTCHNFIIPDYQNVL